MFYFFILILFLLLFFFIVYSWRRSCNETLYQFRNIGYVGFGTAVLLLILYLFVKLVLFTSDLDPWRRVLNCVESYPAFLAHISIIAIGLLGIAMFISNVSLMRHEGMRPRNMVGTFLQLIQIAAIVLAFIIAEWFFVISRDMESSFLRYFLKFLILYAYCLLDYIECIILGTMVMGWIAARQKPKHDKDFIIILGCSINKTGGLLPLLRGRTNAAVHYAWEQEIENGKKVLYVPSGGQGSDEIMSEGSAMELYLLAHSAEENEVFPEKKSRNTYENFKFSFALIDGLKENARIAFSTTNYHVLRSGMLAHRIGRDIEAISSSTKWYFWPNGFAREVVGICEMTKKYHLLAAGILALLCMGLQFILYF